jgi:hypothetical protein
MTTAGGRGTPLVAKPLTVSHARGMGSAWGRTGTVGRWLRDASLRGLRGQPVGQVVPADAGFL